uniref:ANIS5_cation-bd domain-containing protein n=1 Tax=Panagrellus redivivus TaxID=6233 RepID=A0A7E4WBI3_PANRE
MYSYSFLFVSILALLVIVQAGDDGKLKLKHLIKHGAGDRTFAKNLSKEDKVAYFKIVKNGNLTRAQVEEKLQGFVSGLSPDLQSKYALLVKTREDHKAQIKARVAAALPNLSIETQKFVAEMERISSDKSLSTKAAWKKLQELRKSAPAIAKSELPKLFRGIGGGKNHKGFAVGQAEKNKKKVDVQFNSDDDFGVDAVVVGTI